MPSEPVLLKEATSGWHAHARWTWSHFARLEGTALEVSNLHDSSVSHVDIDRYVRALVNDDPAVAQTYAAGWRFFESFPAMLNDFAEPAMACPDALQRIPANLFKPLLWILIGPHGSGTVLHQDTLSTHAWLAVIQGKKRIALHPPARFGNDYAHQRQLAVEVLRERRSSHAWHYLEIEPKDLLLIPSDWWHEVQNEGPTIGLTRNFVTPDIIDQVGKAAAAQGLERLLPWLARP